VKKIRDFGENSYGETTKGNVEERGLNLYRLLKNKVFTSNVE
jgi:hypothetical protein